MQQVRILEMQLKTTLSNINTTSSSGRVLNPDDESQDDYDSDDEEESK